MSAVEKESPDAEPPTMRAARAILSAGYRPVPITPKKKRPIGADWALIRHHPEKWRDEAVGIGIILGDDGSGKGIIDLEVDDPTRAGRTLDRMFPDGIPATACFQANLGMHYTFLYDPRLARYGQTIIKGETDRKTGKVSGNRHYLGIEIRIGTIDPAKPVQMQSIIPPTARDDGSAREWIAPDGGVLDPESLFAHAERYILPLPECVFADLDRFALARDEAESEVEPTWDKEDVKAAILPHALALAKEWGLRVTGNRPTAKGFIECRAIDRADAEPSCGFNPTTGVYTDRKTGTDLSLFNLGLALGAASDFPSLVNNLGRRFGVKPKVDGEGFVPFIPIVPDPGDPGEWDPPVIQEAVDPVPFPLEVFPASLQDLCRQGAATLQCPVDYFAALALGLAGAVIGRSVCLSVSSTWEVYSNLYLAVVGSPGSKKSPVLKIMSRPLWNIDRDLREAFQQEKADYKKVAEDDRGEPPIRRHLVLDDTTREAFALQLSRNPRGLALCKDELTGWVLALNAYKASGKGDDKQFWMSLYSNYAVKVTRKVDQEDLWVSPSFGAVVGCLTPGTLPMIRDGQADDGWVDRILFAFPDNPIRARRWSRDEIAPGLIEEWEAAIRSLYRPMVKDPETDRERPFFVHFAADAEGPWEDWFNAHNAEMVAPGFPACLEGHWSKLEGYCLRIALILSRLRQAYDPDGGDRPRDVDALDIWEAAKVIAYFKNHLRRARAHLVYRADDGFDEARQILEWITEEQISTFVGRDVIRKFRRFTDRDRDRGLAWLVGRRFIRQRQFEQKPSQHGGRPRTPTFDVNPHYGSGTIGINGTKPPFTDD